MKCYNTHRNPLVRRRQVLWLALWLILIPFQSVSAQTGKPDSPEPATPVQTGSIAYGTRYMIATAHPEATRVGAEILKGGGSAVDAAIAAELVLGLVEPQSSGIGGGGFALYYDKASNQVYSFDGRETAPATAGQYLFQGEDSKPMDFYDAAVGGRAVGTPGAVRLMEMMHKRFGAKPWRDLFSPAITLAESGFTVTPRLAAMVEKDAMKLRNFTPTLLYFFPDSQAPINEGGRLINPPYARTLRKIAQEGADGFYKGDIPERVAKLVREDFENPGLLSVEDFQNYKAIERKSLCRTYRAHLVCTAGEPAGGLTLLIALGIAEHFNLASYGPASVDSWHILSEASRLAIADRNFYMADPHYVQSPGEMLLDPDYLKERASQISLNKVIQKAMPGVPKGWQKMKPAAEPVYPKPPGTTHISVVDTRGNILSMTSSIEDSFGSRMYAEGFMLNNQLTDFSFVPEVDGKPIANRVEGGKRPRSSMAPVIVFSPIGTPLLVTGSAGGEAITGYLLQRIVAIIDWRMDIVSALSAPNVINRGRGIELEAGAADLIEALRARGNPVEMKELNSGLTAIHIESGVMTGAADPRREGTAAGE